MNHLTFENFGYMTAGYFATKTAIRALGGIRNLLKSPTDVTKLGSWAVVTGSTDGIGKAYAFVLAEKGMNIVLISRNPAKLETVANEIRANHRNIQVKTVAVDFTTSDTEYIPRVEEALKNLDVALLVNNVGMTYDYPDEYLKIKGGMKTVHDVVNVNLTSLNAMVHVCLPAMVAKKKGAIVNISSLTAILPSPLMAVYSSSKAYVTKFSKTLEQEYSRYGIIIQTVQPGQVVSKMSGVEQSLLAPNPDRWVRSALSRLGIYSYSMGYWAHDFVAWLGDVLPHGLLVSLCYREFASVRDKRLAQLEKEK